MSSGEMSEAVVREVMRQVTITMDGAEGTEMEKCCGAFHAVVAKCILAGMPVASVRQCFEIVLQYNPAFAMQSLIPAGSA